MKIKKKSGALLEQTLKEDDKQLQDIDPSKASEKEIAKAVQATVDDAAGEISDADAKNAAKEVKAAAQEINADTAALSPEVADDERDYLVLDSKLKEALDIALEDALYNKESGQPALFRGKLWTNVLVIGLPGSGKTSIITDWAKSKGVNVLDLAANDPETQDAIYGITIKDDTKPNSITKAHSTMLDPLDRPNSVLFLDEYNRAPDRSRAVFLKLINGHYINDPNEPGGRRHFPNLLFTVAAINPGGLGTDKTANALNSAERNRFALQVEYDSEAQETVDYITYGIDGGIRQLKKSDPKYMTYLEGYLRAQDIGLFILNHEDFKYDDRDSEDRLYGQQLQILTHRLLGDQLVKSRGRIDWLKNWVTKFSRLAGGTDKNGKYEDGARQMLIDILDDYKAPTLADLIKKKEKQLKIKLAPDDVDLAKISKIDAAAQEKQEDDENIYGKGHAAKVAATQDDVLAGMANVMDGEWK